MKSHAILRTNVGLTTNIKVIISGSYSLYADSIISNTELSSSRYRKMEFNKENYWDEILPHFFKSTPVDISFDIKDNNDNDNMSTNFSNQYDDIYQYGARNIISNKDYLEEFEYFAPLYISKNNLPSNFIIFRIDGSGLISLNKENFREEVLNKIKCVKAFDLTTKTPLGEWLNKNITNNKSFPVTPFYMDFRKLEFSSWIGIDYEDGGYSEKSVMLDSTLIQEQLYSDFERLTLQGYKNNKVVFPHILNLSFLYDDTPATPSSLRKWSINRYLGFYLDSLELVKYVSPYSLPEVKPDVIIDKYNILYSISEIEPFIQDKKQEFPYIEIGGEFYKVEKFLEQQPSKLTRTLVSTNTYEDIEGQSLITKYKIISDINLEGRESEINQNLIYITSEDDVNKLTFYNKTPFDIVDFHEADVWLINIDGKYHNIEKVENNFFIRSDYAFYQTLEKFDYYINDPDPNHRKSINLKVDEENEPKKFGIFKCKFTDIKDFDLNIIETQFSKFEYINTDKLTFTDETKMYGIDHLSNASPKNIDDFKINGSVVNIPTSSEYTANSELFRLIDGELSSIWKKNAKRVKWGFQKSVSSNDYPYLLNNSFSAEDFNRTTNTINPQPDRVERNLDYFLTINPDDETYSHHSLHVIDNELITYSGIIYSDNKVVLTNVSNIGSFAIGDYILIDGETKTNILNIFFSNGWNILTNISSFTNTSGGYVKNLTRTPFALDRYLNINYDQDYFSYFFGKKSSFDSGNIILNTEKWSYFNTGDNTTPNITLFRGLKFNLYEVDGVKITEDKIETINIKSNNTFDNYKFAILASHNNFSVTSDGLNVATVSSNINYMRWSVIDEWKHDKIYNTQSISKYNETLYLALTQSQIVDPHKFPYNSNDWIILTSSNIYWSPIIDGTNITTKNNFYYFAQSKLSGSIIPPLVYNYGEYYYSTGEDGNNFWKPDFMYATNSVVLHKGKIWKSNTLNTKIPGSNNYFVSNESYVNYWQEDNSLSTIWTPVELWRRDKKYDTTNSEWNTSIGLVEGHYVVYDDVVYVTKTSPTIGIEPSLDSNWIRLYSLVPDTDFLYEDNFDNGSNPIIQLNNRLYYCINNNKTTKTITKKNLLLDVSDPISTLENGINIYINKKWKNVLVNIYINDNTYSDILVDDFNFVVNKDKLSNTNRDDLYSDLYSKLSASNFMSAINDLENNYDFSDKIRYIIIEEDLSLKIYDFNDLNTLNGLPILLICNGPDEFLTKIQSNKIEPINLSESRIKPSRKLDDGNIISIDQLNYYSDSSLAVNINKRTDEPIKIPNSSGLKNITYNNLYRHSGYYSPIFNKVELFKSHSLTQSSSNYKFDTELTHFGIIKERVISKVNTRNNILKLRNNPNIKSVYPLLDEYGYTTTDFFIFKSTWDLEYHVECIEVAQTSLVTSNKSLVYINADNNTNNNNLSQL